MKDCLIPEKITKDLAEELGIHVGDGHMSFRHYSYCVTYEYSISGNSNETDYLVGYVKPLIQKLYGLSMGVYERKDRNELKIQCKSKRLYLFKRSLGLPNGKKNNITIPKIVLDSPYTTDFLRGLFDTDGYLKLQYRNKNGVPYPRLDITSISRPLLEQVNVFLLSLGFTTCLLDEVKKPLSNGTICKGSRLYIYGKENFYKWANLIGFSNPKNKRKLVIFEKLQARIALATSASL